MKICILWEGGGNWKMENEICECLQEAIGFKDLSVEDLTKGYVRQEKIPGYRCIFCGTFFEVGVIYSSRERSVIAEKAVKEHIEDIHGSAFQCLIKLDKQVSGLSEIQKKIIENLYERAEVKDIAEDMGISPATVRTHKFNLQKMKREAKIFLALMNKIEEKEGQTPQVEVSTDKNCIETISGQDIFNINSLHPFLNQWGIK